jgi:hypothetical protein
MEMDFGDRVSEELSRRVKGHGKGGIETKEGSEQGMTWVWVGTGIPTK